MKKILQAKYIEECSEILNISARQVEKVLSLLTSDCTVPFIARYRKEQTGNLDETKIRSIENQYNNIETREDRRSFILDTLLKQEMLTPLLKKSIQTAQNLLQLEDLYAPFKSKRKTKAVLAKENGLESMFEMIVNGEISIDQIEQDFNQGKFNVNKDKIKTFKDALDGCKAIIIDEIIYSDGLKDALRNYYNENAVVVSTKHKEAESCKDFLKFKDYFNFSESIQSLMQAKSAHRFLAMRRGMQLKVLKVCVEADNDAALAIVEKFYRVRNCNTIKIIKFCCKMAVSIYLHPSLENEIFTNLRSLADESSIKVFAVNLKNLLMAPYLGGKRVLAIDPGIRTGCKIVVVDETGKLVFDDVIYPHPPKSDTVASKELLEFIINKFNVEYIAIGSGTYGRETLEFLQTFVAPVKTKKIPATLISEAGASVYSASSVAIEEFPDKDVTVRGAVSIGRRFQDPLSELVKIDPKSIGVGQYQHDVNASKLKKNLTSVVSDCVNFVGVDLNTASKHILSFISGIGPAVAQNIVKYRDQHGRFKSRKELLKISRFSEKIFEQSAGFLRIYDGENPLDKTFVHPERFEVINNWCENNNFSLTELVENKNVFDRFKNDQDLEKLIGTMTFDDICKSISAPSQDPRVEFKNTEFDKKIKSIADVVVGATYIGIINNITNFGAFVDIGIKESGLVHVSQLANKFVSDPLEVVKIGQEVKVRVIEVDKNRKRISLTCKTNASANSSVKASVKSTLKSSVKSTVKSTQSSSYIDKNSNIKKNAFSQLKNFKI